MSYKAINIALPLPEEEKKRISKICLSLKSSKPDISYPIHNNIPHITLVQAIMSEEEISDTKHMILQRFENHGPLSLTYTGYHIGNTLCDIDIEKTALLTKLQEDILAFTKYSRGRKCTPDMFLLPDTISDKSIHWVDNFTNYSTKEKYRPHITLGSGEPSIPFEKQRFEASNILFGHMGNFCSILETV